MGEPPRIARSELLAVMAQDHDAGARLNPRDLGAQARLAPEGAAEASVRIEHAGRVARVAGISLLAGTPALRQSRSPLTMRAMANNAIERRDSAVPPRIEVLTAARDPAHPAGRMLISSPREIDGIVRRIPEGRVLTVGTLRTSLARNHRADYTCPTTTDAFLQIAAAAAEAERATVGGRPAPYWRMVHDNGSLVEFPTGGVAAQIRRLTQEGIDVLHVGGAPRVTLVEHFAWAPPPLGRKVR
jgi:alkylated DNA nucleotide flippase Atl1